MWQWDVAFENGVGGKFVSTNVLWLWLLLGCFGGEEGRRNKTQQNSKKKTKIDMNCGILLETPKKKPPQNPLEDDFPLERGGKKNDTQPTRNPETWGFTHLVYWKPSAKRRGKDPVAGKRHHDIPHVFSLKENFL